MDNKNLTIVASVLAAFLVFVLVFGNLLVDKISTRVIEELKRTYTPGPYDPGFDPDKINPNLLRD